MGSLSWKGDKPWQGPGSISWAVRVICGLAAWWRGIQIGFLLFECWKLVIKHPSHVVFCKMGEITVSLMGIRIGKEPCLHSSYQQTVVVALAIIIIILKIADIQCRVGTWESAPQSSQQGRGCHAGPCDGGWMNDLQALPPGTCLDTSFHSLYVFASSNPSPG